MFDLMKNDVELAREAVKRGLASDEQLKEALAEKEKGGAQESVITIMIKKGILSDEKVKDLVEELKRRVKEAGDEKEAAQIEFGEEAASKGYVTYTELWEAIEDRMRKGEEKEGAEADIGNMLYRAGTLSLDEALDVLKSKGKVIMKCPECNAQYHVEDYMENQEYTCLKCGAPLELPKKIDTLSVDGTAYDTKTHIRSMDDMFIGKKVGQCQIVKKLGEGGMGVVYKGRHTTLNRDVAVKMLSPALMGEMHKKRFLREARAAAKLEHPNIVQVYDAGEFEGYNYIVMQFIDGASLGDKLAKGGKFEQLAAVRIIKDAARALAEAHKNGMIHRDIKPDNIMMTGDGEVKVADFGLVKSADVEKDLGISRSMLMGTPHYMAPEQFEGVAPDPRVDIYALGITLFEMVTGKKPFDGKTAFKIMEAHLRKEPPRPETIVKDIHPELSRVILKALEKEPDKRYQSAEELIEDLEKVERLFTGEKIAGPSRFPVIPVVVLVLLAAGGIVGYLLYKRHADWLDLVGNAERMLTQTRAVVEPALQRHEYYEAMNKLKEFPLQYRETPAYKKVQEMLTNAKRAFVDYCRSNLKRAETIAKDKGPEEAITFLATFIEGAERVAQAACRGDKAVDEAIAACKTRLDELKRGEKAERERWANQRKEVDRLVGEGDLDRAVELLEGFSTYVVSIRDEVESETERLKEKRRGRVGRFLRELESRKREVEGVTEPERLDGLLAFLEGAAKDKLKEIRTLAQADLITYQKVKTRLREFMAAMKDVENLLARGDPGEGEKALSIVKGFLESELPQLKSLAEAKVLYVKRRMYPDMVYVPGGEFEAGSKDPSDQNRLRKENLKGFFIDRAEVTNSQYQRFVDAGGYSNRTFWDPKALELIDGFKDSTGLPGPAGWRSGRYPEGEKDLPVRGISFYEAQAYARWADKRLPTELEWEKAASWDESKGVKRIFPWGNMFEFEDRSWCNVGDTDGPKAAGSFPHDKSPYGLSDMAGNVSEWTGTMRGKKMVVRGGSYRDISESRARTTFSGYTCDPAQRRPHIGFRCARDDK